MTPSGRNRFAVGAALAALLLAGLAVAAVTHTRHSPMAALAPLPPPPIVPSRPFTALQSLLQRDAMIENTMDLLGDQIGHREIFR